MLLHPDVDAAVFETARGGVLREGLGFDRCEVAVVTNIGDGDHLGLNYITTVEDLAVVKRVIVQNVAANGMRGPECGRSAWSPRMAENCPGSVTFFAADRHHPRDGDAPRARAAASCIVDGDAHRRVRKGNCAATHRAGRRPAHRNGSIGFQVENVMAAVGRGLGRSASTGTRSAAACAASSAMPTTRPGRFNVFDYRGATLIADYGHNPDAMRALVRAVETHAGASAARWSSAAPATGATKTSGARPKSWATRSTT